MQNQSNKKYKILSANKISKYYSADSILENVSLDIYANEHYGLIGPNGSGKTTLLKIINGLEEPSSGNITIKKDIQIGWVPQHIKDLGNFSVYEYIISDFSELINRLHIAEEKLASVSKENLENELKKYQKIRDEYDAKNLDDINTQVDTILESFGLGDKKEQNVNSLSGGEKNVLTLAKALLANPDLLILDEPGNHLDYKGLVWLEQFLEKYKKAILIVSHNRYLLDRICDNIFDIENKEVKEYSGNYSAYRLNKLRNLVAQQAHYSANIKKLNRIEALVKKFQEIASRLPDPAWGKRLRSMRTRFEREKKNTGDKPQFSNQKIAVNFSNNKSKSKYAFKLCNYSKSFGDLSLYENASMDIFCGEKVALVGPNGSGKSTLIKDIIQHGNWEDSTIRVGPSQKIGYCSQEFDIKDKNISIMEDFLSLGSLNNNQVFSLLSPFLFEWEDMNKTINNLSGGEKKRIQLAKLIYLKTNFLILDEPTNHLDIPSREAVEEALCDFDGTVLIVSHDRYFLDKVVDKVIEIKDRTLKSYTGNFTEYWMKANPIKHISKSRIKTRNISRNKDNTKALKDNKNIKITEIENRIEELEREKQQLEKDIADVFSKNDHIKGRQLSNNLDRVNSKLNKLYSEWDILCS